MRTISLLTAASVLTVGLCAQTDQPVEKRTLKANRTLVYHAIPPQVDNLSDFLSESQWYGRLRLNTFKWDWSQEIPGKRQDNWAVGLGGSLTVKTAYFYGFGATIDAYLADGYGHVLTVGNQLAGDFIVRQRKLQHARRSVGAALENAAHRVECVCTLAQSGGEGGGQCFFVRVGVAAAGDAATFFQCFDEIQRARQLGREGHLRDKLAVF
jgi:hypothetical protein